MAIGYPLGAITVKGVNLGATAGTLIVGIALSLTAFMAFDIKYEAPYPHHPNTILETGEVVRLGGPKWCIDMAAKKLGGTPLVESSLTETKYLALAHIIAGFFEPISGSMDRFATKLPSEASGIYVLHLAVLITGGYDVSA